MTKLTILEGLSEVRFLGSQEILTQIENCIEGADRVRIAVAYLGTSGLNSLLQKVEPFLKGEKQLQLIVGISSYRITEWQALVKLMKLKQKFKNLEIRYYYHEGFHPKMFVFDSSNDFSVIIGSSNLTNAGLSNNAEANIFLKMKDEKVQAVQDIVSYWNCVWNSAQPMSVSIVNKYKASFQKTAKQNTANDIELTRTPLPDFPLFGVMGDKVATDASYWKIAPGQQGCRWPEWKKEIVRGAGFLAIGWSELGNLQKINELPEKLFKKEIKKKISKNDYEEDPNYIASQFWSFCSKMKRGDIVVAYSKKTIFGIGIVNGEYYFDQNAESYSHKRAVKWVALPEMTVQKKIWRPLATNNVVNVIRDPTTISYLQTQIKRPNK